MELLNDPHFGFGEFFNQLTQLEATGRKLARVYRSPKAKKLIDRLACDQQDLILPNIRDKRVAKEYQLFSGLEATVNAKLELYASAPRLFFDILTGGWGSVESWQERNAKEYFAIGYLVHLVRTEGLGKIRRCKRQKCQRWYVARLNGQTCCGSRCRKKQNSEDEGFKARRKVYMRNYRATGGRIR